MDKTAMTNGVAITLYETTQPDWIKQEISGQIAASLRLDLAANRLLSWNAFQDVLSALEFISLAFWRDAELPGCSSNLLAHLMQFAEDHYW